MVDLLQGSFNVNRNVNISHIIQRFLGQGSPLAQSVQHVTLDVRVVGSNPMLGVEFI